MKINIAKYEPGRIGGGWSFADNLAKGLGEDLASFDEADVYLIPGASMVERKDVELAKAKGKKIVLRIDNHLLPSRNRNTGMQKMREFADAADLIIYQSNWARDYLEVYLFFPPVSIEKKQAVILNGVDLNLFTFREHHDNNYLYIRSSRIAEKGWEMARFWYSQNFTPQTTLGVIGRFSNENLEYNFDFYNNEPYKFYGQISRESVAALFGHYEHFLYSYFMDACSNTLIEALVSGCKIIDIYGMLQTGGAPEIMLAFKIYGRSYFDLERMTQDYKDAINELL